MLAPLVSLLPIYLLIALGAVAIRTRLIAPDALPHLSRFALVICMPVIVASAVSRAGDLSQFNWRFIAGYAIASLIVLGLGSLLMRRLFGQRAGLALMMGMGMACANSIFLGYPVALVLFPDQVDQLFAWVLTAENIAVIPVALTLADAMTQDRGASLAASVARTLRQMIRNPVLIGLAAGVLLALLDIRLTGPLEQTRALVAGAAPLLALFFVGGTVANADWRGTGAPVLVVALAKLVIHPALALVILWLMPGIGPELAIPAMVFAAMPMFAIFPILSARHGGAELASSALVVTTILGAVTVGALVLLV